MNDCLGIILARGGSKGIPRKNIRLLDGIPLIAHTIRAALDSGVIDKLVVSTDSKEIAKIAQEHGAEVPFMRPAALAGDTVWSRDALKHAVLECEKIFGRQWKYVMELPCIAPLRGSIHIQEAFQMLSKNAVDSVTSVCRVWDKHPVRMKRINEGLLSDFCSEYPEGEGSRRQELEPCYIRNGAIYAMTRDCIVEKFSRHGDKCMAYVMDEEFSVNIDTNIDFDIANQYLARQDTNTIKFECPLHDFDIDLTGLDVTEGNDAKILICNPGSSYRYDAEYLSTFSSLQVIATPSTGVTHIDTDYTEQNGIEVYCLLDDRGALDHISASAEFTWLLLLALVRHFHKSVTKVQELHWRDVEEECRGIELQGKALGIVGLGRIGSRVARYAESFDMFVSYYDPHVASRSYHRIQNLQEMFESNDLIVISPYLTESSRGMIDYSVLERCKNTIVVNTSRGEVVNEEDICRAVREGKITYACDVVQSEQDLNRFWESDLFRLSREGKVLITPHIAGATVESQTKALQAIVNILRREKWV